MALRRFLLGATFVFLLAGAITPQARAVGPEEKQYNEMIAKAVAYLKSAQAEDGSFSKGQNVGISGIVMSGLLQSGRLQPNDPTLTKGLSFLESLVNATEGSIAGQNPRLKNYLTAVNVMAFSAADRDGKYKEIVNNGTKFLKGLQWDEVNGKSTSDPFYGGVGYDGKSRPDLSNTQMFLDALKAAGVPNSDPAFKKAMVFVSRCQNLKSEHNDQPWGAKINDGSFIYNPAGGGEGRGGDAQPNPDANMPGYGSMTYAGLKSMIHAGVDKNDPRVKAAMEWIRKNYTFERNPGLPQGRDQQGMFYYYHTMAKALDAFGEDYVTDDKGVKHDWRKDMAEMLAKRQRPDGSWANEADRFMEGDPNLVTGFALMTLHYCKPKK